MAKKHQAPKQPQPAAPPKTGGSKLNPAEIADQVAEFERRVGVLVMNSWEQPNVTGLNHTGKRDFAHSLMQVIGRIKRGWDKGLALCESPIELRLLTAFLFDMSDAALNVRHLDDDAEMIVEMDGDGQSEDSCLYLQAEVGSYRVDFLIHIRHLGAVTRLAVECDGHDWHERTKEQAQRDRARDRALLRDGVSVIRFTGSEVYANADAARDEVVKTVAKLRQDLVEQKEREFAGVLRYAGTLQEMALDGEDPEEIEMERGRRKQVDAQARSRMSDELQDMLYGRWEEPGEFHIDEGVTFVWPGPELLEDGLHLFDSLVIDGTELDFMILYITSHGEKREIEPGVVVGKTTFRAMQIAIECTWGDEADDVRALRNRVLAANGVTVLRFEPYEALRDAHGCVKQVWDVISHLRGYPPEPEDDHEEGAAAMSLTLIPEAAE